MSIENDIRQIAVAHQAADGALLPMLVAVNRALGYVPAEADAVLADLLNITKADVAGMVSFYSDFRRAPPGQRRVAVCRAEACQAAGGDALAAEIEAATGCAMGATAADGSVTLDAAYCFGNCALAPAVMVDGALIGRATPARFVEAFGKAGAP